MGSANLSVNDLVGAVSTETISKEAVTSTVHPSATINSLKIDAGFSSGFISNASLINGTITSVAPYENKAVSPTFAEMVVEFNRTVLKIEPRPIGTLVKSEYDISVRCLNEEISEFKEAYKQGDIIGMIDAITDLKYFADGVLYKMGLTAPSIDKIGAAVHNANMTKKLGVNAKRGDGSAADAVKPDNWLAPEERISLILDHQDAAG